MAAPAAPGAADPPAPSAAGPSAARPSAGELGQREVVGPGGCAFAGVATGAREPGLVAIAGPAT